MLKSISPVPLSEISKRYEKTNDKTLAVFAFGHQNFISESSAREATREGGWLAIHSDSTECAFALIEALIRLGDPRDDVDHFVDCLFRLSMLQEYFTLDQRLEICRHALSVSESARFFKGISGSLCNLGGSLSNAGKLDEAIPFLDRAISASLADDTRSYFRNIVECRKVTKTKLRFLGSKLLCGMCHTLVVTEDHGIPRSFCPHCKAPLVVPCKRCEESGIILDGTRFVQCSDCSGCGAILAEGTSERTQDDIHIEKRP